MVSVVSIDRELTLGELIKKERLRAGLSFGALSEASGIVKSQLHRLETDRLKRPNPAHLAALAGPLGLPLFSLYAAAGYHPAELSLLEPELVRKLAGLSPEALRSITTMLNELVDTGHATWDGSALAVKPTEASSDPETLVS